MTDKVTEVDLNVNKTLIRKQACFLKLTEEEVEMLAGLMIPKVFLAGQTIVIEGDPVDSFYLIEEGKAEVKKFKHNNPKEMEKVAVLSADKGDAIGLNDRGFYSLSGLRTATVIALTDMKVLYMSIPLFHGFSLNYPHVNEIMQGQAMKFLKNVS